MARSKKAGRQRKKRTKEEWEAMKKDNPSLGQKKAEYRLAEKTNEAFEKYYEGIGIVPEEEWKEFLEVMKKPLPTTFRITGSRSQAQELLKIIKGQYLNKLTDAYVGGVRIDPHFLPWYPDQMAWQLDFTRKEIRENSTLKSLHDFLISETESGNISRQEAVSMLPPLLMDIEPHHKILDMCAAPGSKTAQLLEMLHSNEEIPEPEGFVVANDMDNKRCYLMTHQVKRIQSPNCMIINHDARILPNMITSKEKVGEFVKYDRVLCDVPCSGDGTMRKNPDIWSKWHANGAYNLHRIQKKVLQRGLELLAVGGKLVYSTCSLNPIEDEAVILTLIKQCDGSVELLDVSDKLQGLKYSKGTYSWKVMSKAGAWFERLDQAPEYFQKNWDSTMYPPLITEAQDAKLERCIRVLPHQQNTGAFFIAVLQKTKELPWISARSHKPGPIINPKLKLDPSEKKDGEHFTYGVRSKSGLYLYGKCNICDILLQGRGDHDSHKKGKKHMVNLERFEAAKSKMERVKEQTDMERESTFKGVKEGTDTDRDGAEEPPAKKNRIENLEQDDVADPSLSMEETPGTSTDQQTESQPGEEERVDKDLLLDEGAIKVVMRGHKEDPFYFCSKDEPVWPKIRSFYDISDDMNVEQLMFRNMKRVLYYVSEPVRNLVLCNDERVKFINLGVKCFTNAPSPLVLDCDYRLSQDGMLAVQRKIKGRRVNLTRDDVVTMLSQENPFIFKFSNRAQEDIHILSPGSAVFQFTPSESDPEPNVEIIFCGWRGKTSVRSFVSRDERSHYLRLCGVELSDIRAEVQEAKIARDSLSLDNSRTATPVGVPSGDEAELKQWTDGNEDPRGTEEDEWEASAELNGTHKGEPQVKDCEGDKLDRKDSENKNLDGKDVESCKLDQKSSDSVKQEWENSDCDKEAENSNTVDKVEMETGD